MYIICKLVSITRKRHTQNHMYGTNNIFYILLITSHSHLVSTRKILIEIISIFNG